MAPKELLDVLLSNLPFLITIFIVIGGATVTFLSNRKSVESQNKLAINAKEAEHENKVSEFRHQWIQDVRECGADICQLVHDIQFLIVFRNVDKSNFEQAMKNDDTASVKLLGQRIQENYNQLVETRSKYFRTMSKLKLLFKRDEPETTTLFDTLSSVGELFYDLEKTHIDNKKVETITTELQVILKAEWEVTKSRSWVTHKK